MPMNFLNTAATGAASEAIVQLAAPMISGSIVPMLPATASIEYGAVIKASLYEGLRALLQPMIEKYF